MASMPTKAMKAAPYRLINEEFTKLDKAKTQMLLYHCFMSGILMNRELVPRPGIKTAGIDQRGTIYYDPEFIDKLNVQQVVHLLAHECSHWIYGHMHRCGTRDKKKWNYACDAVINDLLVAESIGEVIPDGVYLPGSKDKTSEQVYAELPDNPSGGGGGTYQAGGIGDDLLEEGEPVSESERVEIEQQVRNEVAEAYHTAKMKGSLSVNMRQFAEKLICSKIPWYEKLERYMVNLIKGEYSWTRPNRRFIGRGIYLPSVGRVQAMGRMGLLIDVSGSVSAPEIKHYNGHMKRIVEQCNPEAVHVAYCDTAVDKYEVYEQGDLDNIEVKFYSGGGTDMPAGLDYLATQGVDFDIVVVLTDGYTNWPTHEYPFPVLWCISTDQVAPAEAGITIPFEVEDK